MQQLRSESSELTTVFPTTEPCLQIRLPRTALLDALVVALAHHQVLTLIFAFAHGLVVLALVFAFAHAFLVPLVFPIVFPLPIALVFAFAHAFPGFQLVCQQRWCAKCHCITCFGFRLRVT